MGYVINLYIIIFIIIILFGRSNVHVLGGHGRRPTLAAADGWRNALKFPKHFDP